MGRPRTGSVRPRGNTWLASVPKLHPKPDESPRLECGGFPTEDAAWEWITAQLERLGAGLEPEKPSRAARPKRAPAATPAPTRPKVPLQPIAEAWAQERYLELHGAGGDRTNQVTTQINKHLLPTFDGLLELDFIEGRALAKDWIRTMAGWPPLTEGSKLLPASRPTMQSTAANRLWILRQILEYARLHGHDVPDYLKGVHAMEAETSQPGCIVGP
jgi:hypothetical protein